MIWLHIQIDNPWSDRWHILKDWSGSFTKHKHWEFNCYATNQLIEITAEVTTACDHAGFQIKLGLLGYNVEFQIYDGRHWDYGNKCYVNYEESKIE